MLITSKMTTQDIAYSEARLAAGRAAHIESAEAKRLRLMRESGEIQPAARIGSCLIWSNNAFAND